MSVTVGVSGIPGAGEGLFAAHAIDAGALVTFFRGRLLSPKEFYALDASGAAEIDYCIHYSGTDFAVCPVLDEPTPPDKETTHLGHKANDAACLSVDRGVPDPVASFSQQLVSYLASSGNVALEFDEARAASLQAGDTVDIPVRALQVIPVGGEVFLSYGAPYWASRVYSPLFWRNTADQDRPLARALRAEAVSLLASRDRVGALPELPPRAALRVTAEGQAELIDQDTNAALTDEALVPVALALFNRDPQVLRLKRPLLRALIVRVLRSQ